jgi:hypothetical protein
MVCAICIVTVRVVNDKRCFGNAAMAAERESGGGGWCKELRARDGACVWATSVTRTCERWEMRADERRAYVRVTGRAGARRGKPQRMSRRCPTRRFEICSQYTSSSFCCGPSNCCTEPPHPKLDLHDTFSLTQFPSPTTEACIQKRGFVCARCQLGWGRWKRWREGRGNR